MTLTRTSNNDLATLGLIGRDAKVRQIIETIRTAAPSDASVLIEGESGTGKQSIAAAIHALSHRRAGSFIRINCAGVPPELFEAELFGYQKGAFNGAERDKRGLIEAASLGTLLLDEIADLPGHLQTKICRVVQDHKLCRLGDEHEIEVNFRLVVTTSRNTSALLEEGLLRKDLYFRISTIKITVPALRERLDDIPLIAQHILDSFNVRYDRKIRGFSEEAVNCLLRYDWPGNVHELESVVERAVLFCAGDEVLPESLPDHLHGKELRNPPFVIPPLVSMEEIEREAICQTLARTSGNVKRSAQILRYPRPTFYRKLKKFGIKVDRDAPTDAGKFATSA